MTRREFTITKLTDKGGHWTATVTAAGKPYEVTRKYGSWQSVVVKRPRSQNVMRVYHDVLPDVAAALQTKVRAAEKKRAKP